MYKQFSRAVESVSCLMHSTKETKNLCAHIAGMQIMNLNEKECVINFKN